MRYHPTGVPSGVLLVQSLTVPSQTRTLYDGAGRKTADVLYTAGVEKWRTSYGNGGDHTDVTPPAGGTATTTFADARGQKTRLLQYHGPTPAGAADTTSYSYNSAGAMSAMTDPAGMSVVKSFGPTVFMNFGPGRKRLQIASGASGVAESCG
ncbi:MAG: hypothetical protein ACYDDU_21395, partial [Dermatophilaceae bacterium]